MSAHGGPRPLRPRAEASTDTAPRVAQHVCPVKRRRPRRRAQADREAIWRVERGSCEERAETLRCRMVLQREDAPSVEDGNGVEEVLFGRMRAPPERDGHVEEAAGREAAARSAGDRDDHLLRQAGRRRRAVWSAPTSPVDAPRPDAGSTGGPQRNHRSPGSARIGGPRRDLGGRRQVVVASVAVWHHAAKASSGNWAVGVPSAVVSSGGQTGSSRSTPAAAPPSDRDGRRTR